MNKALLIIICDFLLLSLLSLARFDEAPLDQQPEQVPPADQVTSQSDLMDALQTALAEEQRTREQLQSELEDTRTEAKTKEQLLAEREALLRNLQQNLKTTEEQARLLDQERTALDQQVTASVRSIIELEQQLNSATVETKVNSARLEALQAEIQMREREADRLQDKLAKVEQQRQLTEAEKQQLAIKLQATETEKQMVREQLSATQVQVAQVQQEKELIRQEKEVIQQHATVLAEGVSTLAEKSGELTQEIRDHRPLSGNVIFSGFFSNRVETEFTARRTGVLGQTGDTKSTRTILVSSGDQIYAVYHAEETLLQVNSGEVKWDYLYGHMRRAFALISLDRVTFLQSDPRIVLAPVTKEQAAELGVAIYPLAQDPFKFNEAVLVGGAEGYYGEAPFQLDPTAPKYVRMQRERFSKLFGKFTPSRSDLVFSKTGEVLGIMVNNEYCLVLNNLAPAGEITLGARIQDPRNAKVLSEVGFQVSMLPAQVR